MPGEFFNAEVAGERISKIITQSIIHIKILVALQEFKRSDWQGLKELMMPLEYQAVVFLCRKYLKCENLPIPCEPQYRYSNMEVNLVSLTIDTNISNAIKYLGKNKAATEYCLTFPISDAVKSFLACMEELSVCVKDRISRTPEMEKEHITNLKKLYSENQEMSDKINRFQQKIIQLDNQRKAMIAAKEADMIQHIEEIEIIKAEFKQMMLDEIAYSEDQMRKDWKSSEFRQVELVNEVKTQTTYIENLIKERLQKEKELRSKRYKLESQFASILEQYDTDMGDRQKQKEELTKQLEEGRLELEQLEERFTAQEWEYTNLMQDRENYDQRRFNEKIFAIRQQIAARVIQRAFRKFMRRKYGKKKMKVGKGGKLKKAKKKEA